jgi:lactocepin
MKNTSLLRRVLSVVLTVALLCTLLVPAASAAKNNDNVEELKLTPVDPGTLENQKLGETEADSSIEQEAHALTDVVRVSIVLEKPSTLDAGFSTEGIANNAAAVAYREGLRADQAALTAKIEKAIGNKLDVQWNLTLAANNISANVLYGQINAIKAVPGVKDVFLENRYEPEAAVDEDEPNNGSASYMTGANIAWANGYTGAGSKVAVIDTGADIDHQSFSGEGL